jgi:hypothetical protein
MGAFDEIIYNGTAYQTKSLVCWQDYYEVRDGQLWHLSYDVEDRSDPSATGLMRIVGMFTPVNERWERDDFTGKVYTHKGPTLTFEKGNLTGVREWGESEDSRYGD